MSSKHYDVVIVGGGNGGIGAAMAYAQAGLKPLLIEQHNLAGGCAASIVRGRFEFDASLHVLMYEDMGIGKKFRDEYGLTEEFIKVPNSFSYGGPFAKKLEQYPMQVESFLADASQKHPEWAPHLQKYFGICFEAVQGRIAVTQGMPVEEASKQFPAYGEFSKLSLKQGMEKLGIPQDLQELLSMLWFYEGPSVEDFPFDYNALVFGGLFGMDSYFPKHTCHGYLAEFESIIRRLGGDIWYNKNRRTPNP